MLYVNDPLLIKNKLQSILDNSNSEGEKMIIMVHNNNFCRDGKIISTDGRVRLIKCPYKGVNSVRLMSIPVIKSQNAFYYNSLIT